MYYLLFVLLSIVISTYSQNPTGSKSNCVFPEKLLNECAEILPESNPGSSAQLKKLYPWHVGLYRQKQNSKAVPINICGGTLISSSVVLTAAHCLAEDVDGSLRNISEYIVTAGNDYREFDDERDANNRQIRQISRVVLPSVYGGHPSGFLGDIAIIELKNAFDLSDVVRPSCLDGIANNKKEIHQGQTVGWGLTVASRHPDTRLTKLSVPYVNLTSCLRETSAEFHQYLTNDKFCGEFSNGASICATDNGGGVLSSNEDAKGVLRWYLDGVTSVGLISGGTCETRQFSAFTSVKTYLPLICQSVINTS